MTLGKGFALVLGFVAAIALGVWMAPHITHRTATIAEAVTPAPDVSVEKYQPQQEVKRSRAPQRTIAKRTTPTETAIGLSVGATPIIVPTAAPALHEVLKPLLNKGADMGVAAEEFVDAEQFAAVAHASRNTEIPFMVLKHRIVEEGKSLEVAIREFKPGLNAAVEANRARAAAKSDVRALQG
jgi:hypothetical protein